MKKTNLLILVMFIILSLLAYNLMQEEISKSKDLNKEETRTSFDFEEDTTRYNEIVLEREISKVELTNSIIKANKVIDKTSNETEIILLEEIGTHTVSYDKQKDEWYNSLTDSKISFELKYHAILTIPMSKITLQNKLGKIVLVYEDSDIYCKMVEISNPLININKGLFGKNFSSAEAANIIDLEKNKIKNYINSDKAVRQQANDNLISYFSKMCNELGIELKLDNHIDNNLSGFVEIEYNHPNKYRDETKYLVIHTTNNYNATANAQSHWDYWNSNPTANASAHFVIDADQIIQCVDIDKISWNVGVNKWMENQTILNQNSIGIEMCNNVEFEKTMGNTVEFIRSYVLPLYPDIKIVKHSDATGKMTCPNMSDVEWNKFIEKIYE